MSQTSVKADKQGYEGVLSNQDLDSNKVKRALVTAQHQAGMNNENVIVTYYMVLMRVRVLPMKV